MANGNPQSAKGYRQAVRGKRHVSSIRRRLVSKQEPTLAAAGLGGFFQGDREILNGLGHRGGWGLFVAR